MKVNLKVGVRPTLIFSHSGKSSALVVRRGPACPSRLAKVSVKDGSRLATLSKVSVRVESRRPLSFLVRSLRLFSALHLLPFTEKS